MQFISAMNRWELDFGPLMRSSVTDHIDDARNALEQIFLEYVSPNAARTERRQSPSISVPPEYDPEKETVTQQEMHRDKTVLYTLIKDSVERKCRYTLFFEAGKWMVGKKDVFRSSQQKWSSRAI
jgi:hypothetical protein